MADVGPRLQEMEQVGYLNFIYRLRQQYFTVYESNCHLIGEVEDDELTPYRGDIHLAKGLIDTHLINNDLLDDLDASPAGTVGVV